MTAGVRRLFATVALAVVMASGAVAAQSMPGMDLDTRMPVGGSRATSQKQSTAPKMPPGTVVEQSAVDEMSSMAGMPADHDHGGMDLEPATVVPALDGAMQTGAMQGGAAPASARDPDAYAEGLESDDMDGMDMSGNAKHLSVLIDRLEAVHTRDGHGQALESQAWYGGDLDKLWIKIDGERDDGGLGATRTEALWDHAVAAYWSLQAGVRQDFGGGPGRTWLAFGVQGLSPFWFDVQATAYVGEGGRTALRFETDYDLRIVRRLVLQPDVKVDVFGRNDARREIGAGLSEIEAGLRLRYEISRTVAPYVGVVWNRKFGNTARHARDADEAVRKIEAVAGIRFRF